MAHNRTFWSNGANIDVLVLDEAQSSANVLDVMNL